MLFENINKIAVIGGSGTGKSTLAKNMGKIFNLPVYHIDAMHHLENWVPRDKDERDRMILEKANKPKWVIDGTYKGTLEERVKKADMIIFLDYSTIARLKGILGRYFKDKGKERPEIPGCKEQMNFDFIKMTINWKRTKGNTIYEILERNKNKKILIFKNRRKLNKWYEKEFNRKIEVY